MIGSVGAQAGMYYLRQVHQAQAAAPVTMEPTADSADSDDAVSSAAESDEGSASSGGGGPAANLLSSSTLASLLGLQMVNGQAQGGASGAQLNLSQITLPPSMDPNALLNNPTLQALQSIA